MFDVPLEAKTTLSWHAELPIEDREWNVGLITGPSGSGKSTLARHLWPDRVAATWEWPADRALVDGFPAHMGIRDIAGPAQLGWARVAARMAAAIPDAQQR